MVAWARNSRLDEESGPPQRLATARVREGQRKRERVMPSSNWVSHFSRFRLLEICIGLGSWVAEAMVWGTNFFVMGLEASLSMLLLVMCFSIVSPDIRIEKGA